VPIGEDPHLFVSEDGEAYTKSGLNTLWRRGRDRAGVGKVTTRDIRPFALAQMEKAGETVEKIREAAAHTTTGQTEDYLNQHRERFSAFVMRTPRRPKT
jgi:integrase